MIPGINAPILLPTCQGCGRLQGNGVMIEPGGHGCTICQDAKAYLSFCEPPGFKKQLSSR